MGFRKKEREDMTEKTENNESVDERKPFKNNKFIAKKDFKIVQNDVNIDIKEGEQVNVPERFIHNLITEGVIDPQ